MSISTSIWDQSTIADIKTYLGTDEKEDLPASTEPKYTLLAQNFNRKVAGLAEVAQRTRYGMMIALTWARQSVAASQTAASFYRNSGGDASLIKAVMPWNGWVVGLGVYVENPRTAGTCTINVEINGTPIALESVIDGTDTQMTYDTQDTVAAEAAGDSFSAGDYIEVTFTTSADWAAGATPSICVDLYLAYGE